jgi:hypothetical protein
MSIRDQLKTAQGRLSEIPDEIEAVGHVAEIENRELSDEDNTRIADLSAEADKLNASIRNLSAAVDHLDKQQAAKITPALIQAQDSEQYVPNGNRLLPARVRQTKSKIYANTFDAYQAVLYDAWRRQLPKRDGRRHGYPWWFFGARSDGGHDYRTDGTVGRLSCE